jgi:hypothetical protein
MFLNIGQAGLARRIHKQGISAQPSIGNKLKDLSRDAIPETQFEIDEMLVGRWMRK